MLVATQALAQEPGPSTRTALIEQAQAEKSTHLQPYISNRVEGYLNRIQLRLSGSLRYYPFFESAYSGGGFTLGAGYRHPVSSYNTVSVRGSITFSGYKRVEGEFIAPRLFDRQADLLVVGGWREATEVGYYGLGTATSQDDRANYGFQQPYGYAILNFRPGRRFVLLRGGVEASQWEQTPGSGSAPSVDEVYTPSTLVGLGAKVSYLHTQGTAGIDWRPSAGYARRGGFYGVTLHDFADNDTSYGFNQWDYEAIQHVPLLREAWVLSFRGHVSTATAKDGQQIPFFMLPSVGGGSSLRGFSSWRFRDLNSLLLQAEWRVMVNRFVDLGIFYDAGKVTDRTSDLDLENLRNDYGIGIRFHGPMATPLRIDVATGGDGFRIVWASSAPF
jgi:hypothetical protein